MKRVFYIFAAFIFISFVVTGSVLNYLTLSHLNQSIEDKVKRDLEILATTTQGALANNDYERVEEEVFLWGKLEPHIVLFEVILDGDIEIIKFAREIRTSNILHLTRTIALPSGRIITFTIEYDLSEHNKKSVLIGVAFLSMSCCIAAIFIVLLWRILQNLAFIPLNREIAERKRAEAETIESRNFLQTIIDGIPDHVLVIDPDYRVVLANKAVRKATGKTDIVSDGMSCHQVSHHRDDPCEEREHPCPLKEVIEAGKPVTVIHTHYDINDNKNFVEVTASPIFNDSGEVIHVIEACRDITERKQAEVALQKSEKNLRTTLDSIGDAVIVTDTDGCVNRMNPVAEHLTGWAFKEAQGKPLTEVFRIVNARTRESVENPIKRVLKTGKIVGLANHTMLIAKNGCQYQIADSAAPIKDANGKMTGVVLVFRDVTEEYRVQEELRQSEAKYKGLFEFMSSGVAVYEAVDNGKDFTFKDFNRAGEGIENVKKDKLIGKSLLETFPGVKEFGLFEVLQRVWKTAKPEHYPTTIYQDKRISGWRENYVYKLPSGEVVAMYDDVTERKQAEDKVKGLAHILDTSLNEIYIFDADTLKFIQVNKGARNNIGYDMEELQKLTPLDIKPEFTSESFAELVEPLRANEKQIINFETLHKRKDSSLYPVEVHLQLSFLGSQQVFVAIILDITRRKQAESERERLLKTVTAKNKELQSIVYVASHDLRSPLVNIEGFSGELAKSCKQLEELMADAVFDETEAKEAKELVNCYIPESLKFIKAGTAKMASLLAGLLQVSRVGSAAVNTVAIDMNGMLNRVTSATQFEAKECGATITVDNLPNCLGDEAMVNQVFSNLIGNALKYLNPQRKPEIRISGRIEDANSIYCVEDNGIGIDPDHQSKIFEVFHRLNPADTAGGEGLGLTIVTRILDRLNGSIRIESESGKGSKFFVSLPKAKP